MSLRNKQLEEMQSSRGEQESAGLASANIELRFHNQMLLESLRLKTEDQNAMKQRVEQLERENEELRREKKLDWVRVEPSSTSKQTMNRTALFLLGLLMLTLLFVGGDGSQRIKTMGLSLDSWRLGLAQKTALADRKAGGQSRICKSLLVKQQVFDILKSADTGQQPELELYKTGLLSYLDAHRQYCPNYAEQTTLNPHKAS